MEQQEGQKEPSTCSDLEVTGSKRLEYGLENSFRHVFQVIDFNKEGSVKKSSLQVICANVCRVLEILYMPDHLEVFKGDGKKLDEDGFLEYVRHLVRKATVAGNKVNYGKLEDISWVIISKVRSQQDRILSGEDTFLLLKAFNKVDIYGNLVIHKEEVEKMLESFMKAIGTPWTPGPMENFYSADFWTFWKLLKCLETKYIQSSPRSLYEEGLISIEDKYVKEITKAGMLIKKGHKVKSLKERWFVLQPGRLSYYTTKSMRELKGTIIINGKATVESLPDSKTGKCRFTVKCGEKNVSYEMEAESQRDKNEWINQIQASIECEKGKSLLYMELEKRMVERAKKQKQAAEEEQRRTDQETLIKEQMQELEKMKIAQKEAEAHAEKEAAMLEDERKRREELELLKEEYEKLLENERNAREEEEAVRKEQEQLLLEERVRREDLEKIKVMQEELLETERKHREGLEEESKEQAKVLEEERRKMKELDEARQKAEEAIAEAHAKLQAAEEERRKKAEAVEMAKDKTRRMKIPERLAQPLSKVCQGFVTHRGAGAFIEEDFKKKDAEETKVKPEPVNKTVDDGGERTAIIESNLVRPSEKSLFLKDE
eukprot:gene15571-6838_t